MLVLWNNKRSLVKDIWAGQGICPQCGVNRDFHFIRVVETAKLYYVLPIMKHTAERMWACDTCGTIQKMQKKDYNQAVKNQFIALRNGAIPPEMIARDGNPEELKFGGKIAGFICAVLFALLMIATGVTAALSGVIPVMLLAVGVGILPLIPASRTFSQTLAKKQAYDNLKRIGRI